MPTICLHALAIPGLALLAAAQSVSPQEFDQRTVQLPLYRPIDLGVVPGWKYSRAVDVNNLRQVTGTLVPGRTSEPMAFVWLPRPAFGLHAGMSALGTLPLGVSNGSWPGAIDDCGRIVGTAIGNTPGSASTHKAFLWQGDVMHELGSLTGSSSGASAMNRNGVVVGWSYIPPGSTMRAFETHVRCGDRPTGDVIDLGALGGSWSTASDVNDKGHVVGMTSFRQPPANVLAVPFFRDENGSVDLPTPAGASFGHARALNDRSVVVGSYQYEGDVRAALWRRTRNGWTVTELGTFAGTTHNGPSAIDEQDRVVGHASVDGIDSRAYVWIAGVYHALDDLLLTRQPIRIARTGGINSFGDIAATGYNALGEERAFLLLRMR